MIPLKYICFVRCCSITRQITSGAAGQPDPSGVNSYDDEFRSQFLQDYIEATLQSIRQIHQLYLAAMNNLLKLIR